MKTVLVFLIFQAAAVGQFTPPSGGGGGTGTVTNVSAANLSPLFTVSVGTPTTTPSIAFVLTNAGQNTIYGGPASGGVGAPSFQTAPTISAANMTNFPTFNQNTSGTAANLSGTPTVPNGTAAATQSQNDNSTKLATTAYTDLAVSNAVAGVNPAVAVQAATTGVLPNSPTYANGVAGVGATLTAGSAAALVIDGYTLVLLDRVLIKNQASTFQNGVYFLSTLGTGVIPYVLTRALDFDTPSDMNNTGAIPVINGTVNGTTQWVITSKVTTVGTDAVTFAQFSSNPANQITTSTACGGDLNGTMPNCGVAQVNGAVVPTSAVVVGSNASKQLIAATTTGSGSTAVLGTSPTFTTSIIITPVATASLGSCASSTGPSRRAAVTDATTPSIGVVVTGGGAVFATVHCSLTDGNWYVDGL